MTGFFSHRLRDDRKYLVAKFVINHVLLACMIMSIFSLYWGATYKRSSYYHKLNLLAVLQDDGALTDVLPTLIDQVPGTWHVYNSSAFQDRFGVAADEIDSKILDLVHRREYWFSFNAKPNSTAALLDSLTSASAPAFNSTDYFGSIYESGRDPTNMKSSIVPLLTELQTLYQAYYTTTFLPSLLSNVSDSLSSVPAENVAAAGVMNFSQLDYRPFNDYVLLGPLQVGLIYCILLTFFQLSLFGSIHMRLGQKLKPIHMLLYRYIIAYVNYFFLSLFFCAVSAAFQVNFTLAFGKGGFMVAWMSSWLLMAAVGGANENMITVILSFGPQYLGFWLIFWVVMNISPSFYPMALSNNFYRYGYAMPIHNGVEIFRVIFLNLDKKDLGRNYGILVAWCVLNALLFPVAMKIVIHKKKKDAQKAALASHGN